MADRRILRRQSARSQARRDHRVDRQGVVEPLRELQPGLHPLYQLLTRYGIALFDQLRVSGGGAVPAVSVLAMLMWPRWADQSL